MRKYSIFHPFFMSFYSKEFYQDTGKNWKGFSFVFFLILNILLCIVIIMKYQSLLASKIDKYGSELIKQFPVIKTTPAGITVDKKGPHYIADPEDGELLMVIDTEGKADKALIEKSKLLITKTRFIYKKSLLETRTYDLTGFEEEFIIDHEFLYACIEFVRNWLFVVIFPFLFIGLFIFRIIQILVNSLIGFIMTRILKATMNYSDLLSLAIMSMTPVLIIESVLDYYDILFPYRQFILFLLAMGYLFYGIKVNVGKKQVKQSPNPGQYS